jgi:hypothetical protein
MKNARLSMVRRAWRNACHPLLEAQVALRAERQHADFDPFPLRRGVTHLYRRGVVRHGLSLGDIRQQVAASDFAFDAMGRTHDCAATHPGLDEGMKAHRAELQELRSRLCSMVQC